MANVINLKSSNYRLRLFNGDIGLWVVDKTEADKRSSSAFFRVPVSVSEMEKLQANRFRSEAKISISVPDGTRFETKNLLVMSPDGFYEMRDVKFVEEFTYSDYALSAREILVSMGYKTRDKPSGHYVARLADGTGPIFMGDSFDDVLRQVKDGTPRPPNSGPRFMKPDPWE